MEQGGTGNVFRKYLYILLLDSLCYEIKNTDVEQALASEAASKFMDFSNLPTNHKLYNNERNVLEPGCLKVCEMTCD